jgi:hypothetical protein
VYNAAISIALLEKLFSYLQQCNHVIRKNKMKMMINDNALEKCAIRVIMLRQCIKRVGLKRPHSIDTKNCYVWGYICAIPN